MSELKADNTFVFGEECLAYKKSEVDKVIEDIVKGASSMFRDFSMCRGLDTKSPLGRIADVAFKHWTGVERTLSNNRQLRLDKAALLRSNKNLHLQLKSETLGRQNDKFEYNLNIRHHKYKRCLTMARWCASRSLAWMADPADDVLHKSDFYDKWKLRWRELAEKFKPNNSTAQ